MVAFTCNNCGASVKKNVVEKHCYHQCPTRTINVTCIDCLQDFGPDSYGAHIKCLTENEKYGAKGTVERSNNKGEIKQQDWLSMIANVYETHSLDFKHKQILEHIMKFDNIPRKKKPFLNFIKSSARMFSKNEALVESLYDLLDKEYKSRISDSNTKNNPVQNKAEPKYKETNDCDETGVNDKEVHSEKKKKRRNKHKSESKDAESSAASDEAETSQTELEVSENQPPTPSESDSTKKTHLSKKEKKEKKKREKYLTELNAIEKYEKSEETNNTENGESEETGRKKKSKKNRHKSESEAETFVTKLKSEETNGVENAPNSVPLERKLSKKEKKRKISENAAAEGEAKKKLKNHKGGDEVQAKEDQKENADDESEEFIKPDKFKIDKVVRIILESQGGEVALKRLAKRVITEYQIRCGIQDSDYIMAKFQKKIFHIPGVKIIKDKAILQ